MKSQAIDVDIGVDKCVGVGAGTYVDVWVSVWA